MPTKVLATPYLEFKFLKNQMIYLGGKMITIPTDFVAEENNKPIPTMIDGVRFANSGDPGVITKPKFDMEKIHKVELKNELPILPAQPKGMSKTYHEKLCDAAYERAAEAKVYNDAIRQRVGHYAAIKIILVVSDPFAGEEEVEGLAEMAEAIKAQQEHDDAVAAEEYDNDAKGIKTEKPAKK